MPITQNDQAASAPSDAMFARHIEHIELYGYTVVEGALSPQEVQTYRASVERLYETDPGVAVKRTEEPDLYHIENLANKGELFESFFLNPKVLPLAYHVLGDDFIAQDIWSFGVAPNGFTNAATSTGRFHSDEPVQIPNYSLSMVHLYALVDLTRKNGATRVVPGSHKLGRCPDKERYEGEVALEAPAGSCLVFLGSVWHASGPNWTEEIRTTFGAYFSRPWMKPYIDFTRSLRPEVLARATPEARRIFGFDSRAPHTERWQWDEKAGRPKEEFLTELRARFGYGDCCL